MTNACREADLSKEIIRIGTFTGWPGEDENDQSSKPSPLALAEAGFYFTGIGDEVKCFSCNVSFKKWEKHNIPNMVHATISPKCPFIMDKGASGPFMMDQGVSNKRVFVPEDREYNAILKLLDQICAKTIRQSQNSNPASSLVCDSLRMLYGESMLADSRRARARPGSNTIDTRSSSSSPARPAMSKETRVRGGKRGTRTASQSSIPESPPPSPECNNNAMRTQASSSSATAAIITSADRPQIQRTRSYAPDPRGSRSHSETIANRQNSNPGMDHAEYQESEQARLATFSQWPSIRGSSPREFAQAGFIFLGHPDRVQCVFCNGILRNWNDNDAPMEEHSKHFPQCSFVKEYHSSAVNMSKLRHPKFKTEHSRLVSFQNKNWANGNIPSPQELSKAGFFYVGHGDSVKCFFCDGGLRNWESDDDPWREHARWFPTCGYVKQAKGKAYIESVVKNTNMAEYQTASVDQTSVKSLANQGQREVDPREVMARMDSAIVKTVIKMDIPKRLVEKAISKRLAENGKDFTSSEALLEAIFNLDLQEEQAATSVKEPANKDSSSTAAGKGGAAGEMEKLDVAQAAKENEESMRLAEENRLLKEQRQCKICMDEEVCMAFLPCGHLVCCATCAPALNSCPICRAKVRGTVRTYLS